MGIPNPRGAGSDRPMDWISPAEDRRVRKFLCGQSLSLLFHCAPGADAKVQRPGSVHSVTDVFADVAIPRWLLESALGRRQPQLPRPSEAGAPQRQTLPIPAPWSLSSPRFTSLSTSLTSRLSTSLSNPFFIDLSHSPKHPQENLSEGGSRCLRPVSTMRRSLACRRRHSPRKKNPCRMQAVFRQARLHTTRLRTAPARHAQNDASPKGHPKKGRRAHDCGGPFAPGALLRPRRSISDGRPDCSPQLWRGCRPEHPWAQENLHPILHWRANPGPATRRLNDPACPPAQIPAPWHQARGAPLHPRTAFHSGSA
jgi:hypothetical protein